MAIVEPNVRTVVDASTRGSTPGRESRPGTWTNTATEPDWEGGGNLTGAADVLVATFTSALALDDLRVKRWRFFVELALIDNHTGSEPGVEVRCYGVPGIKEGEKIVALTDDESGTITVRSNWATPPAGTLVSALEGSARLELDPHGGDTNRDFAFHVESFGIEYEKDEDVGGGGGGGGGSSPPPGPTDPPQIDLTVEAEIQAAGVGVNLDFFVDGVGAVVPELPNTTELKATTSASSAGIANESPSKLFRGASFTAPASFELGEIGLWLRYTGQRKYLLTVEIWSDGSGEPDAPLFLIGQVPFTQIVSRLEHTELRISTKSRLSYRDAVRAALPAFHFALGEILSAPTFDYFPESAQAVFVLKVGDASTPPAIGPSLVASDASDGSCELSGVAADSSWLEFRNSADPTAKAIATLRNTGLAIELFFSLNSADFGVLFLNGSLLSETGIGIGIGGTSWADAGDKLFVRLDDQFFDTGVTIAPSQANHLILQHTGSRWELWLGGFLQWTDTFALPAYTIAPLGSGTWVGFSGIGAPFDLALDVTVDELSIFNRPLGVEEISIRNAIANFARSDNLGESFSLVNGTRYWVVLSVNGVPGGIDDVANFLELEYGTNGTHGSGEELAVPSLFAGNDPVAWSEITGGAHLRLGEFDERGYHVASQQPVSRLSDFFRFLIGEIARRPYTEIDHDAMDACDRDLAARLGGIFNGFGESFDDWMQGLAREGRVEVTQVERESGPLYRAFGADENFEFPASGFVLSPLPGMVETLRGRDEIKTRFRSYHSIDLSQESGSSERSFREILRADPTFSDLVDIGYPAAYFEALEDQGGGATAQAYFMLLVHDSQTMRDWLGYQVVLRTVARSSVAGPWPTCDVYALEPGDVLTLEAVSGAGSLKCQVRQTVEDLFSPLRGIVLEEVP